MASGYGGKSSMIGLTSEFKASFQKRDDTNISGTYTKSNGEVVTLRVVPPPPVKDVIAPQQRVLRGSKSTGAIPGNNLSEIKSVSNGSSLKGSKRSKKLSADFKEFRNKEIRLNEVTEEDSMAQEEPLSEESEEDLARRLKKEADIREAEAWNAKEEARLRLEQEEFERQRMMARRRSMDQVAKDKKVIEDSKETFKEQGKKLLEVTMEVAVDGYKASVHQKKVHDAVDGLQELGDGIHVKYFARVFEDLLSKFIVVMEKSTEVREILAKNSDMKVGGFGTICRALYKKKIDEIKIPKISKEMVLMEFIAMMVVFSEDDRIDLDPAYLMLHDSYVGNEGLDVETDILEAKQKSAKRFLLLHTQVTEGLKKYLEENPEVARGATEFVMFGDPENGYKSIVIPVRGVRKIVYSAVAMLDKLYSEELQKRENEKIVAEKDRQAEKMKRKERLEKKKAKMMHGIESMVFD